MRNHSHCSRNRLAREGGRAAPQPGRNPSGAKKSAMKPASSSMPSDWYPEKSSAALTNERKHAKQITSIPRGQTSKTSSREAAIPIQHKAVNIREPLENHSSVGANHRREKWPNECATACRYSLATSPA